MSWPRGAAAALPLRAAAAAAGELILDAWVGVCVFVFGVCAAGRKGGGTGSYREAGAGGRSCPLPGGLLEPPPRRESRPPPPASRASGGFFFTGRRECGRGRPGRGRAAELRLSHCVFCLFFSPKVPFPSVRRPAGP